MWNHPRSQIEWLSAIKKTTTHKHYPLVYAQIIPSYCIAQFLFPSFLMSLSFSFSGNGFWHVHKSSLSSFFAEWLESHHHLNNPSPLPPVCMDTSSAVLFMPCFSLSHQLLLPFHPVASLTITLLKASICLQGEIQTHSTSIHVTSCFDPNL